MGTPGTARPAPGARVQLTHVVPRYTPPRIAAIFGEESKLRRWLEVELLAVEGWAATGRVPADAARRLRQVARVDAARVAKLTKEGQALFQLGPSQHELAAILGQPSRCAQRAGTDGPAQSCAR